MTTLGDVWAITAVIVGVATCAWALLLCLALLFPRRSRVAMDAVESHPWKCTLSGVVITVVMGAVGIAMLSMPFPAIKFLGWIVLLALMATSVTGSAGIVLLVSHRLKQVDESMTPYGAFSRAAMFLVLPSILPVLGWFLFAPVIFSMGVGAGLRCMRSREVELASPPLAS